MLPVFYWTLLIAIVLYAFYKGSGEHRLAAAGCIVATVATRMLRPPDALKFQSTEFGILTVDLLLFGVFLFIALRSQRFWPLWVAGFHLVTVSAHLIRAMQIDLIPTTYSLAVQFWSYPVLLCIGIAVWNYQHRRAVEERTGPPAASA